MKDYELRIILLGKISKYYCGSSKTSVIEFSVCGTEKKPSETDTAGPEFNTSLKTGNNYFRNNFALFSNKNSKF